VADLRPGSCLVPGPAPTPREERERTRLRVRALASDASTQPAGELSVRGPGRPEAKEVDAGLWEVAAAAGTPVLLRVDADGHARLDTVTFAPLPDQEAPEVVLSPTPLAVLSIESELDFDVLGPLAEELDRTGLVHPGPLTLTLRLVDGRRVALALELAPGERRTLTLRES
jgi:hypothetical protein